ncbi:MMPL family transporter [Paraconexibacter algicola]|uniref:MMPL family transporter n=1 Tax=Paraconexibacter algicola TaxID=2133960 RepID=A0A2T4UF54_9ACTN|nr:MMPL family transporter [Paraconexibacter algicola]PTL56409.1 MMPL family transporter [Paraconexibacter algicola]
MSSLLARIARAISHRWKRSLAFALATLVVLGVLAGTANPPADSFDVPGADSQQAYDLFRDHTPAFAGGDATLVYTVEQGRITDARPKAAVQAALAKVKQLDGVISVADPFAQGGALSRDGRLASVDVRYSTEAADIKKKDGEDLEKAAEVPEASGVQMSQRGIVVDTAQQQAQAPVGELVGVGIAIILLTLLFRSKAAMGATLFGAIIGVAVGQMLLAALAEPLGLPSFATTIAIMLGLGAGIDYSLLIIGRFREQLAAGDSTRDAAAKAAATAGTAVVAAGLIVMVAIAGLLVVGIPAIGKMGLGAAIGVFAVVLSALLILPIMMGAIAKRLRPKEAAHVDPSPGFARWGSIITARPWLAIAAGTLALLVFAFPALDLRLGQPDDGNQPTSKTQRVAYDALSEAFGPGSNGPLLLAVDTPDRDAQTDAQVQRISAAVAAQPGIASVQPPITSEDGEMATIFAVPTTSPQDARTSDLIERLRDDVLPAATRGTGLDVYVGGTTATFEDFSAKVASRLPLFIGVVVGLSVLLLVMAFRSLLIPLLSAVLNLLSIVAAYGAVTAVFQDGFGASLIGVDSGIPIVSFVPVLMFAILFGLSMDYNVFLLSRMHEAYNNGDGPRDSVVHGMARIGKVVLFAGLIMAAVFLAFVTTDDVISKMFGVGLGLAILIDVLIVRLVITPAVVLLLGDRAWWLPGWLDRLLPNVSLEGHAVESVDPQAPAAPREKVLA